MFQRIYLLLALCLVLSACQQKNRIGSGNLYQGQTIDFEQQLTKIAFGSCSDQEKEQDMWQYVTRNKPQLWVWLGDNIYKTTTDVTEIEAAYIKQKSNEEYLKIRASMPVLGIWDDNDYGMNDGNRTYKRRKQSKELMFDFLDVPPGTPARERKGAYQSYTFGPEGTQVKIILLDIRYFKDPLKPNPDTTIRYLPDPDAELLGKAQWEWLEEELTNSKAQVHLIGSSIQVIPEEHGYEKWADYPTERKKLFDLLVKTKAANPLFLSGDRHFAELSRISIDGLEQPLYELTSSGLTHAYEELEDEPNKYRVDDLLPFRNFGLVFIDWTDSGPKLRVQVRGLKNQFFLEEDLE